MHITITNFKFYTTESKFDFTENELNLIQGPSNCGKTTIFEAIYWCLYGSSKVVYPKGKKASNRSPTIITLSFESGLTIKRIKPPDSLELTLPENKVIEDESAQNWIDLFFGTKTVFLSTTYMKQKRENPLLELKISEKKDLLQELTFGKTTDLNHEDPQFYTETIDLETKKVKSSILTLKGKIAILENQCEEQKTLFNSNKLHYSELFNSDEDILSQVEKLQNPEEKKIKNKTPTIKFLEKLRTINIEHEKNITSFKKELISLRTEWKIYQYNTDKKEQLEKQIQMCTLQLQLIPYTKHELDSFIETIISQNLYKEHKKLLFESKNTIPIVQFSFLENNITHVQTIQECIFKTKALNNQLKSLKCNTQFSVEQFKCNILSQIATLETELKTGLEKEQLIKEKEQIKREYEFALKQYNIYVKEKKTHDSKKIELNSLITDMELSKLAYENYYNTDDIKNAVNLIRLANSQDSSNSVFNVSNLDNKIETKSVLSKYYTSKSGFNNLMQMYQKMMFDTTISSIVLTCPNCSTSLELKDNTLILNTTEQLSVNQARNDLITNAITTVQKLESLLRKYKQNQTVVNNFHLPVDPIVIQEPVKPINNLITITGNQNLNEIKKSIRDLHSIIIPDYDLLFQLLNITIPINLNDIIMYVIQLESLINNNQEYIHYKKLLNNFNTLTYLELPNPDITKNKVNEYLTNIVSLKSQISMYEKELKSIPNIVLPQKSEFEVETTILTYVTIISNNTKKINIGKQIIDFNTLKSSLDDNVAIMNKLIVRQVNLDKIKQHIIESSSHALSETVDSINSILTQMSLLLYNNDTRIILSMFKKLKTKDYLKAQPNIEIIRGYGDEEIIYDFEELSGGEKSRVSLVLTLALSTISSTPLLFLDESLSSMNHELQNRCIKLIKEHSNKTIINVCHNISEGIHSNCITILSNE